MVKLINISNDGDVAVRSIPFKSIALEVLQILLQLIPMGHVTTYKALADLMGVHPRYVGVLIRGNKSPIVVPCHRVVKSDGSLGGYTFNGLSNVEFKRKVLEVEGVRVVNRRVPKEYILSKLIN
mgnify:CR=1 FL=1